MNTPKHPKHPNLINAFILERPFSTATGGFVFAFEVRISMQGQDGYELISIAADNVQKACKSCYHVGFELIESLTDVEFKQRWGGDGIDICTVPISNNSIRVKASFHCLNKEGVMETIMQAFAEQGFPLIKLT